MAITPLPTPPSRGDDPTTFRTDADAFLGALPAFATEANALAVDVGNDAAAAATSASGAADSATAAAASETVAAGAANYQGDYDAGTFYAVGESVSYLGSVFVKKTTAPAGTTPVDGADWLEIGGGVVADFQEFTTSGTWTKPDGATFVYIEAVGGGGGGGNHTTGDEAGGGGGGGGAARIMRASALGATEAVTIGAGGTGAANGASSEGSDGGDTTFGAHLTANGGKRGAGNIFLAASFHCKSGNGLGVEYSSNTQRSGNGGYGSGSGGYGIGSSSYGGDAVIGGAGGGGCDASTSGVGGVSEMGGDGGDGVATSSTKGGDGTAPGGGGGGSSNDGGGGDGAAGRVRVWSW